MTSFATAAQISNRYISLKFSAASREDWMGLAKDAAKIISLIKSEKSDVFANGPRVHGAAQQSQLDVLDMREQRMCAVFDNAQMAAYKLVA